MDDRPHMDMISSEKKGKRTRKNTEETGRAKDHYYSRTSENGNSETEAEEEINELNKKQCDPSQMSGSPKPGDNSDGPCMMPLLSVASIVEEYNKKSNITPPPFLVSTGTARIAQNGPPVGAVDIGIAKSTYFFQVALPGVKKDPGEFSCEIECDGRVHIRGVTSTGGEVVKRQARVFQMKFQQQCPPGSFTLSFNLPGPVDPRLFFPNFRSDGILEAVIAKL